jgi:hypothetical protein
VNTHTLQFITSREEIDEEYQRRLREQQMRKGGKSAKQDTGVCLCAASST